MRKYSVYCALSLTALFCAALIVTESPAHAVGGCGRVITLVKKSETTRGGSVVYKSNSNSSGRDLSYGQGNHSQAGPAILFGYRSGLFPSGSSITAMDLSGNKIATGFRRGRCSRVYVPSSGTYTNICGEYERWYFGFNAGAALKSKAPNGMLIKAAGTTCIRVGDVLDRREQY